MDVSGDEKIFSNRNSNSSAFSPGFESFVGGNFLKIKKYNLKRRYDVLAAVIMKITVLMDVTLCSP